MGEFEAAAELVEYAIQTDEQVFWISSGVLLKTA